MSSEFAGRVQPGDILADKYRVDQVLGAGGMGVVVAAEHLELCERVAIKFLLDDAATDGELSERFLREARAAVKIKSEHVVRIIDVGRLDSGAPYMVMEYLEGRDLAQTLEHGRVSIEDAVDYVIQACEAMNVAHHAGIIHRDLKPANLFLTKRPDGSPIIKVLDFGISKVKSTEAAQLSLTRTQTMMGSPLYMSPEQMRSSKDVDRRTDVWSLGVILHELISGDVPFSGSGFPDVLVKVMTEAAPPLRSLRPEVPAGLEALVLRCLSKSPADRFSSVAALAVALSPFASTRTLSLQGRLRQSLSEPPVAAVAERAEQGSLVETRIEVGAPVPVLPFAGRAGAAVNAAGTLASRGSNGEASPPSAAELPLGTHTSWEDAAPGSRKPASGRWPMRVALLAGTGAFAAGLFALFASDPPAPATATPAATPVGPAPTAPSSPPVLAPADPPALATAAAAPAPAAAAATAAAPASVPAASSPTTPLAKPQATPRRTASRAAAARPRPPAPSARPDAPTATPAPAPKPASAPARSKPLSLEFK